MDKGDPPHHLPETELQRFQQNFSKKLPKLGCYQEKGQVLVRTTFPVPTAHVQMSFFPPRAGSSAPFPKRGHGPVAHSMLYPLSQVAACIPVCSIAPSQHRCPTQGTTGSWRDNPPPAKKGHPCLVISNRRRPHECSGTSTGHQAAEDQRGRGGTARKQNAPEEGGEEDDVIFECEKKTASAYSAQQRELPAWPGPAAQFGRSFSIRSPSLFSNSCKEKAVFRHFCACNTARMKSSSLSPLCLA